MLRARSLLVVATICVMIASAAALVMTRADASAETCSGYEHKVDGLSGHVYTITPEPGETVTGWCVKFSTQLRYGTGNVVDVSDQKHEISHVAWNDEPDGSPTPTPTPTPTEPTEPTEPTGPTEPTEPTEPMEPMEPTQPPTTGPPRHFMTEHTYTCRYVTTTRYQKLDGEWVAISSSRRSTGQRCAPGEPFNPDEEGL